MAKSYTQKMRDFRGKSIQAASPAVGLTTALPNGNKKPLRNEKNVPRISESRARSRSASRTPPARGQPQ